jgi:glycine betaine/proline transport system permease protein
MDPISKFMVDHKIPIGAWGKAFFGFLTDNFDTVFRAFSNGLNFLLDGLVGILLMVPPVLLALIIAAIAWLLQMLDLMQTLPTFVYLIPVLTLFGLGNAPGLIVTIIFVIPTAVRLTHLGVVSVPKSIVEAGEAFGATKSQLLWKVELPSALPTIMAGLTQSIMLSLSMVVFAALIGAGGLGTEINRALGSRRIDLGLEAGLAIVVLAIVLDRMTRIAVGGKK